jgi:hypothetical protein
MDGTHFNSTLSNVGVLPEQRLASVCKYLLNASADEAQAAIEV